MCVNPLQVKEDLKTVALGTSKINYLDPRITVAWYVAVYPVLCIIMMSIDIFDCD